MPKLYKIILTTGAIPEKMKWKNNFWVFLPLSIRVDILFRARFIGLQCIFNLEENERPYINVQMYIIYTPITPCSFSTYSLTSTWKLYFLLTKTATKFDLDFAFHGWIRLVIVNIETLFQTTGIIWLMYISRFHRWSILLR